MANLLYPYKGDQLKLPLEPPPHQPKQRRHSPKGKASGWIETRLGNLKRRNPSTSYYYCWLRRERTAPMKPEKSAERQQGPHRGKHYIPARKLSTVQQMIDDRCSVDEILQLLVPKEKP